MKYFPCKLILFTLALFLLINIIHSNKIKNKLRLKSKFRSRNNKASIKTQVKKTNIKKNGPLTWDVLSEDQALEGMLKNERMYTANTDNNLVTNTVQAPSFLGGRALSENQKSKTFRPVGPFDDSTINFKGNKYSHLYKTQNKNINPGFYGKSRLTRF